MKNPEIQLDDWFGYFYFIQSKLDLALKHYKQSLDIEEDPFVIAENYYYIGRIHFELKEYDISASYLKQSKVKHPYFREKVDVILEEIRKKTKLKD